MKIRFAFVLSSVAALALAGCAAYSTAPTATASTVAVGTEHPPT